MGEQRHEKCSAERAEDAEDRDLGPRAPEPAPADVHPALEEDDDERNDPDTGRRLDRQDGQPREHVARDSSDDQEDRRAWYRKPRANPAHRHGYEQAAGHDEDDSSEVDDLGHCRG
jgi:hypothetical protein